MLDNKTKKFLKGISSTALGLVIAAWFSAQFPVHEINSVLGTIATGTIFIGGSVGGLYLTNWITENFSNKSPKRDFHIVTDEEDEEYDDEYKEEYSNVKEKESTSEAEKLETEIKAIGDPEYYSYIINNFTEAEYLKCFGDAKRLKWDTNFLARVGSTILALYGEEIMAKGNNLCSISSELVAESGAYALLNNKNQVGQVEILNMFKAWNGYLTLEQKIETLDTICEEIGYECHPYHKNRIEQKSSESGDEKPKGRILTFPKK